MSNNNVLSIDISKRNSGYFIPHMNDYGVISTTQTKHGDDFPLYEYIVNEVMLLYKKNNCNIITMEDGFSFGKNKRESQKLVELRACIKWECQKNNIEIITYPPTVIKKNVTGSGKAKKEDIYSSLKNNKKYINIVEKIGELKTTGKNKNDDIYDAIAIYETYLKNS